MNNRKKIVIVFSFLTITLIIVALVVFIAMQPRESYTSLKNNNTTITSVECNSNANEGAIFKSDRAEKNRHTFKATFRNDAIDKMSYTYEGIFPSEDIAENTLSIFHADYNNYMGENGLEIELLTPNFSRFKSTDIINLYVQRNNMEKGLAKLLLLNDKEMGELQTIGVQDFANTYKSKGFECNINY